MNESDKTAISRLGLMLTNLSIDRNYNKLVGGRVVFFKYGIECDKMLFTAEQIVSSKFGFNNVVLMRQNSHDNCSLDIIIGSHK